MYGSLSERKHVENEHALLKRKIAFLDEESFEKRFLKPFFIDRKEIMESYYLQEGFRSCFRELKAREEERWLIDVRERDIVIDFSIVSFRKLFMKGSADVLSRYLIADDEELKQITKDLVSPYFRIQYLSADEESGEIRYLVGIYERIDPSRYRHILDASYRLEDYDADEMNGCEINDGVLLAYQGKRIVDCKIDGVEGNGRIVVPDEKDMVRFLDSERYIVTAHISERNKDASQITVSVSIYEDMYIN